MIVMKLNGGLGNQMFQYAYGRALKERFNDSLFLDVEEFRRTYGHEQRHYSLEAFNLNDDVHVLPISKSRKLLLWKMFNKISRKKASEIARHFGIYWWRNSTYVDLAPRTTMGKKCYFYGYWQSDRYFNGIEDILKKEFVVKKPFLEESKKYLELINKENSICVHIRRGDYVQQGMISCNEEYYLNGISIIEKKHPDANCVIFTDDITWVRDNIHFNKEVSYVDMQNPDYEVLRLMTMCKHFVISNSSFSWWAQYLADNPNKIVIAPSKWHMSGEEDYSIYQKKWIVINNYGEVQI